MDLGATRLQTVRLVVLPALWPAILAAGLLDLRAVVRRLRALVLHHRRVAAAAAGAHLVGDPLRRDADDQRDRDADARDLRRSRSGSRSAAEAARAARERARRPAREGGGMSEAVRFEGVTKRFGAATAVDDLNLTIEAGEFFSLLGPSGCGKTTTLRMVAGFEQPTEGEVFLDGEPVATVPPFKRNVNTVFQSYALFEHLDVQGNVAFGLKRRKVAAAEIETRVRRGARARAADRARDGAARTSSPAASASASRSRARSSTGPRCCCSTSRWARSTSSCASRCRWSSSRSSARSASRSSTSPTTRRRRWRCPTASRSWTTASSSSAARPRRSTSARRKPFVAGFIGISNLMAGTAEDGGVRLADGALVPGADARGLRGRRRGPALGAAGEDLARRARGRHGAARGDGHRARLRRDDDAGDHRARRPARGSSRSSRTRTARTPTTAGRSASAVTLGWRPEHSLVLR